MLARLLGIRSKDERDAIVAFLTLFGTMTSHAVLETARDALFLSQLPASELPWAYVAIAVLSLLVAAAGRVLRGRVPRRFSLSLLLFTGGLVTASFHSLLPGHPRSLFLSLYVWTGVLATAVTVEFWLLVAEVLDIGQAKRVFAAIGAAGLSGALAGSTLSGILLESVPAASLLLVSGSILGATAVAPLFFSARDVPSPRRESSGESSFELLRREPYLRRLLWVVLSSSVLFTGVDFVFKATAAVDLAPEQLGPFFARFYAVVSGVALVVQLAVAPRLFRILGVNGSLLLLPTLLVVGSAGFVLAGGLGAALLVRGTDGALRHSLHRTGTEILYVPLPGAVRDRFKGFVEAVGQRGGQALASVLLLSSLTAGARPAQIGVGLVIASVAWLIATLGIRPHYVDLFRKNLREGLLETHFEVTDLDLHSLEALIGALSSENDHEVLAALDLLAQYGKANLVPALVLYHPSPDVVLRAFALFSGSGRADVDRLVGRLIQHDDERVRAAALRYSASRSDTALLQAAASDPSPLVRTTAVVELIRRGAIDEWKGGDVLRGIIDGGSPELRRALAIAARDLPKGRYSWALVRLAFVREPGLAVDVARSMKDAPDLEYVPTLVRLLAHRECREDARAAILALGPSALPALDRALGDGSLPRTVRRHVPGTVARFKSREAAVVLERHLTLETDEVLELELVRALGHLRALDPTIQVDSRALLDLARAVLARAVHLLHYRVVTERASAEDPSLASPVAEMLGALLNDKESSALERVFRILMAVDPSAEFEVLFAALRSDDARLRESGRELVNHVVPEPLRSGILSMLGDQAPHARLHAAARLYPPATHARFERALTRLGDAANGARADALEELRGVHVECLRSMLLDPSDAIRGVAGYRIVELGLGGLEGELRSALMDRTGALAELSTQAVDLLDRNVAEVSRAG